MLYSLLRPLLFLCDAETAHHITLKSLKLSQRLALNKYLLRATKNSKSCHVMGLNFPNPVGLAAGLDKNGAYIKALAQLGFGFIEIGTVTPQAQMGNPRPRMFRFPKQQAIINRLGFNNLGLAAVVEQIKQSHYQGILGINLGKNKDTSETEAIRDYTIGMQQCYSLADYITINISSPNTPGLRDLQRIDYLSKLLDQLKSQQAVLEQQYERYVPLVIKIAPDLNPADIIPMANCFIQYEIDGVIATNTTITRPSMPNSAVNQQGGLSGAPLKALANQVLADFHQALSSKVALIGVGGITKATDAIEKLQLGADLVQLYTGLIYRGPRLIREIVQAHAAS